MQYSTQKTFDTSGARLYRTITVKANGGYVEIEASSDAITWTVTDTLIEDGGWELFQGKAFIRITPFNGATYEYI